ncbi:MULTISPECIES: AraC family transcriptional regulator [Rhodomicrobium]|uniref:helix-turn-helix domain-containing protein n=1 Tax=Rhodomicrobium TaxID=1068 RepID=UPI000B4C0317|nr:MULTISPECIES: AraC family transcriptional regulator [Rhodomicrobium]
MDACPSRALSVNGLTLRLWPRGAYCARYTPDMPVAGFAFESQSGQHAFASDRVRPFQAVANGMAFTPAGCSIYSEAREGGEYLTLTGPAARLVDMLAGEDQKLPAERFSGRVAEDGIAAAHALRRSLLGGVADPAAIGTAVATFAGELAEAGAPGWRRPPPARSMTPRRIARIEALIDAEFSRPLGIAEMAAACDLSTGFFLRAFKAATGQTPHHLLMSRRVAEARRLLRQTRDSAGEIAHLTGFSSQPHMTTVFKRLIGVTPAAYRAAAAPRLVT